MVEPIRPAGELYRPVGHNQSPVLVAHLLVLRADVQVRRWERHSGRRPRCCTRSRRVGSLVQAGLCVRPVAGMPRHVRRIETGVFGRRSRLQHPRPFGYLLLRPRCWLRLRLRCRYRGRGCRRWLIVEWRRASQRLCPRPWSSVGVRFNLCRGRAWMVAPRSVCLRQLLHRFHMPMVTFDFFQWSPIRVPPPVRQVWPVRPSPPKRPSPNQAIAQLVLILEAGRRRSGVERLPLRFLCSAVPHRFHRNANRPIRHPQPVDRIASCSSRVGVADLVCGENPFAVVDSYPEVELSRCPHSLLYADPICLPPVVVSLLSKPPRRFEKVESRSRLRGSLDLPLSFPTLDVEVLHQSPPQAERPLLVRVPIPRFLRLRVGVVVERRRGGCLTQTVDDCPI